MSWWSVHGIWVRGSSQAPSRYAIRLTQTFLGTARWATGASYHSLARTVNTLWMREGMGNFRTPSKKIMKFTIMKRENEEKFENVCQCSMVITPKQLCILSHEICCISQIQAVQCLVMKKKKMDFNVFPEVLSITQTYWSRLKYTLHI